jgi:hypothetical protein
MKIPLKPKDGIAPHLNSGSTINDHAVAEGVLELEPITVHGKRQSSFHLAVLDSRLKISSTVTVGLPKARKNGFR